MIGVEDPIRNALRELVRQKSIFAWNAMERAEDGTTQWTVVLMGGRTPKPYTTDEVNKLIGMFWEAGT
jgi:hypothetical protein